MEKEFPVSLLSSLQSPPWWQRVRRPALIVIYTAALLMCLWMAYGLRFDFNIPREYQEIFLPCGFFVVAVEILVLNLFRHFGSITRYFSLPDVERLFLATTISAFALYLVRFFLNVRFSPPRGVLIINALLAFMAICLMRIGYRMLHEGRWPAFGSTDIGFERVAIAGAGDVGSNLVEDLAARPAMKMKPVLFLDDDETKWRSLLHGIPVLGRPEVLRHIARKYHITKLIIAMPSAPARRLAEVANIGQKAGLTCVTVPAIDQLTSGKVSLSQLRPIDIEDLLGRDSIALETGAIRQTFANKVVMVTGAGGSIGSELCRQIASFGPSRLLLVEHCEVQLFKIEQELIRLGFGGFIVPLVANVLDPVRMRHIFNAHRPSIIFHAAAHKHVPMMERQPTEAVRNNSLATAQLGDMAVEYGVERFLMISTDKAVNPTNAMGASKRLAEIYLQALFARQPNATKFICVRFGNVLGSSGSVVPTFTRQIATGGPVTVTHPDMVRYFMTIPEAVGLVLQSCSQGQGGEIFVLDMGKPVKIADLARQMIQLSGLKPGVDIDIQYVGLRPGEKLFEELQCRGENYRPTRHPRIMSFQHRPESLASVRAEFDRLDCELYTLSAIEVKERMHKLIPEYTPYIPKDNLNSMVRKSAIASGGNEKQPKVNSSPLDKDAKPALAGI
jgi:FlaA1/EpsC-like NDP-sugar epimerase